MQDYLSRQPYESIKSYTAIQNKLVSMQALEEQFPDTPLLPHNSELREEVDDVCQQASEINSAGYKYLSSQMKKSDLEPEDRQKAEDNFLMCLDKMEEQLSKHKGPYLVG